VNEGVSPSVHRKKAKNSQFKPAASVAHPSALVGLSSKREQKLRRLRHPG